jgi:WD40 repeat protein
VSGSFGNEIKIWNSTDGKLKRTLIGHNDSITAFTSLSNGDFVSGSYDSTIKIWNSTDGRLKRTLIGHNDRITAFTRLSNGDFVSGSYDNTIKIWNSTDGTTKKNCKDKNESFETTIQSTNAKDRTIDSYICPDGIKDVTGMITLPNDNIVIITRFSSILFIWNVTNRKVKMLNSSGFSALTTLPNGDIVIGFWSNRIEIWNSNNLKLKKNLIFSELGTLTALATLSNGDIVIGYTSGKIEIRNATDGKLKSRFRNFERYLDALATIPNGGIVIGSLSSNYIEIWLPSYKSISLDTFLYNIYTSLVYMIKLIIYSE